jgi:maltose alpha-D-glucosyltransferase/alpha-amylase
MDLSPWRGRVPHEMLGRARFPRIGELPYLVTLAPYGFFWFQLREEAEPSPEATHIPPEFFTLVMGQGWGSVLDGRGRAALEREVLPAFLPARRWFGDKGSPLAGMTLSAAIPLHDGDPGTLLAIFDVVTGRGSSRYAIPLGIKWSRFDKIASGPANILSAVRRYAREGTLVDVATDPAFMALILGKIHAGETVEAGDRRVLFQPTHAFAAMPEPTPDAVKPVDREQSNTTTIVDSKYVVKILRRLQSGEHPEIEMGRFLTDIAPFPQAAPLLGSVELVEGETHTALAVVHGFIENQGDAWTVTSNYLDRFIDEQRVLNPDAPAGSVELASYLHRVRHIGRRTAELQNALASRPDIPAFAPEPITGEDLAAWTDALAHRAEAAFDELSRRLPDVNESSRNLLEGIVVGRREVMARIRSHLPASVAAAKIRHHGDYHLGQILFAKDEAYILDFEGEPARSMAERRRKAPAARDVAGLLRSIDYAAAFALERALEAWPDEHARLNIALDDWRKQAVDAFLAGYHEALTAGQLWPADPTEAQRLLDFFLLDKVIYEIAYELANRPNWLRVPLLGLQRILS